MNLIIKSFLIYSLFYSSSLYSEIKFNNKQPSFSISDKKVFNEKLYKLEWNIFCEKKCDHDLAREIEKNIGPTPMPNSIFQGIFKDNNKIIKNVFYSIDQFGLRKSIDSHPEVAKNNHLILAGDSNVFGEWCEDHETLDYDLSKLLQSSSIKNWGRRGGGPHNTLSQMQFFDYKKSIKQKRGIFAYVFYPYMFERVIGTKNYVSWDHGHSPYYSLNSAGNLQKSGNFNNRFLITNFYRFLNLIPFLNALINDFPNVSGEDVKLVAGIFEEMKRQYTRDFSDGKFIVIVNNSFYPVESWKIEILLNELKKNDVQSELINYDLAYTKDHFIDGHLSPSEQTQQALLYQKLFKKYLQ